jgi:hypothetical protein
VIVCVLAGGAIAIAVATRSEPSDFEPAPAPPRSTTELRAAAARAECSVRDYERVEGDGSTASPVSYRSDPPHSGKHGPEPADDAAYYDDPPATEALVHSLRHGRVVIWFDPELEEEDKGVLKAVFDESPPHVILVPRESMPFEVAASAWRHVLGCERTGPEAIDAVRAFRDRWRDRGPEFVP